MADLFSYILYFSALLLVLFVVVFSYKTKMKIKLNPGTVLLSSMFFMALWLFDLATLKIGTYGLSIKAGLTESVGAIPYWVIGIVTLLVLVMISLYNQLYNQHIKDDSFNNLISYTQILGVSLLGLFAIIFGPLQTTELFGVYTLGIYHSALPLVIISELILTLNLK